MAGKGRRANGDGWVYRDGDAYRVKLQVGLDPVTGTPRYRSSRAKTHEEALQRLRRMQSELQQGKLVPAVKGNFEAFLHRWLESHIRPNRAPSTYRQYQWLVDLHIAPLLGKKRIETIQRADIKRLIALKAEQEKEGGQPLSRDTLRLIRAVLHSAFEDAIQEGLLALNPASSVAIPKAPSRDPVFLKPEEATRLFRAAQEDDLAALWMLLLMTGARLGEATGVRWQDIDFRLDQVTVRGQLQRVGGNLVYIPSTKTSRVRVLPLSGELVNRLKAIRLEQEELGHADPDGVALLNPHGRRLDPKYVRDKLTALCTKAGVKVVSPHKLRHTAATLALAETGDLHAVQKLLGHAQISLTANTYGHAVDKAQRRVTSAIARALEGDD